jgi:hypothetical protein
MRPIGNTRPAAGHYGRTETPTVLAFAEFSHVRRRFRDARGVINVPHLSDRWGSVLNWLNSNNRNHRICGPNALLFPRS